MAKPTLAKHGILAELKRTELRLVFQLPEDLSREQGTALDPYHHTLKQVVQEQCEALHSLGRRGELTVTGYAQFENDAFPEPAAAEVGQFLAKTLRRLLERPYRSTHSQAVYDGDLGKCGLSCWFRPRSDDPLFKAEADRQRKIGVPVGTKQVPSLVQDPLNYRTVVYLDLNEWLWREGLGCQCAGLPAAQLIRDVHAALQLRLDRPRKQVETFGIADEVAEARRLLEFFFGHLRASFLVFQYVWINRHKVDWVTGDPSESTGFGPVEAFVAQALESLRHVTSESGPNVSRFDKHTLLPRGVFRVYLLDNYSEAELTLGPEFHHDSEVELHLKQQTQQAAETFGSQISNILDAAASSEERGELGRELVAELATRLPEELHEPLANALMPAGSFRSTVIDPEADSGPEAARTFRDLFTKTTYAREELQAELDELAGQRLPNLKDYKDVLKRLRGAVEGSGLQLFYKGVPVTVTVKRNSRGKGDDTESTGSVLLRSAGTHEASDPVWPQLEAREPQK